MSLQTTDSEAAAHAVAPRVALADIEAAISARYDTTGDDAARHGAGSVSGEVPWTIEQLSRVSICMLVMRSGFVVIGKSAPASADNFNAELGRKFAYEDAVRQLWPLMGYALRDKLAGF